MANGYVIFTQFNEDEDEEEKRKTASQRASEKLKKKKEEEYKVFPKFKETYTPPTRTEAPEPYKEPEKKPTLFEKAKDFGKKIADFLTEKKVIKTRKTFKEEFGIEAPEGVKEEPHGYFDYHALSSIPALQSRINEIDIKQEQRLQQGKSLSPKLEREKENLQELISLPNNSVVTVARRSAAGAVISQKRTIKGVGAGGIDVAESLVQGIGWVGKDIEAVRKVTKPTADQIEEWANAIRPENPDFADQLSQGVGSALTFFIPGIGVAKGASILAKVSPKVALLFGNVVATALESMSEAGSVYEDNTEAGKSEKEASKRASKTFWANSILIGLTNRFGIFSDEAVRLKKILASASTESIQEFVQQAISNVNTDRDWMEGTIESGIIGGIIGGGLGAVDLQRALKAEEVAPPVVIPPQEGAGVVEKKEEPKEQEIIEEISREPSKLEKFEKEPVVMNVGGFMAKLTPEQAIKLADETGNIPPIKPGEKGQVHISLEKIRIGKDKELTLTKLADKFPDVKTSLEKAGIEYAPVVTEKPTKKVEPTKKVKPTPKETLIAEDIVKLKELIAGNKEYAEIAKKYNAEKDKYKSSELYREIVPLIKESHPELTKRLGKDTLITALREIEKPTKGVGVEQEREALMTEQLDKGGQVVKKLPKGVKQMTPLGELVTSYYIDKPDGTIDYYIENKGIIIKLAPSKFAAKPTKEVVEKPPIKKLKKIPDLLDWMKAKNAALKKVSKIENPQKRIAEIKRVRDDFNAIKDENWVTNDRYAAGMIVEATLEIESAKKPTKKAKPKKVAPTKYRIKRKGELSFVTFDTLKEAEKALAYRKSIGDVGGKIVEEKPTKKPKKKKPVKKIVAPKKKAFKPKKVKKKKIIFKASQRKALQAKTKEVLFSGATAEESIKNIDSYLKDAFDNSDDPLFERRLKTIKAEMKRNMFEIAGVDTGHGQRDYVYLQKTRHNPQISELVDRIEEGIFQIEEAINLNTPISMGLAGTGTKPVGEFEDRTKPKKGTHELKLYEKSKELIQKYAQSIGEGYTPRNALGVYYPQTKNIRVDGINNLSTLAHEITHFLDTKFQISDKLLALKGFASNGNPIYDPKTLPIRKAMTKFYVQYYPTGKKTHKLRKRALEGFATLLQKYVETPNKITTEHPLLVNSFLKKGGEYYNPVMDEIIKDLNEVIEEYQGLSDLDKVGTRLTETDPRIDKDSFLKFYDKIRTQIVDEIYPVEVLAKKSKTHFTAQDPSLWLRAFRNSSGIVNNNIVTDRGYWTLRGDTFVKAHDFNYKTLIDLTTERKNTADFASYLVARREHFSYEELDVLKEKVLQLKEQTKGMTAEEAKNTINTSTGQTLLEEVNEAVTNYKELKAILDGDGFTRKEVTGAYEANKERFKEEAKMFDTLVREDLELLNNEIVQLITPTKYDKLTSKQGYASFKRQFYDEILGENNEFPAQIRVGKTKISSLIRRRGSQRTIINPLYSAVANHHEVIRKSMKQIVYNKIVNIGVSAQFPNIFQQLDLKRFVDKNSGAIIYPQEKDNNIIMGRRGYKRTPVLVDAKLKVALDNILTYQNIDVFVKLYTGLSRMFTAGTTGFYPQFAATNIVRDQITAQANTTNKYRTIFTPLTRFYEVLKNKDSEAHKYYTEYMVMGGERQTFTGWQKLPPDKFFARVNEEKKGLEKAIALMEKGTDIASTPVKYSEIVTRASEYINARKAGKPQIVALEEAGRVTAPFHHIGKWGGRYGKTFIRGLPFFNALLQVTDQHIRTGETKEGRKRLALVMMAITAAYIASITTLLNADDDQKEQYKDLKPDELARSLFFPHPSGTKLIRVPVSEFFSPLGTIINMIIADEVLKTKYTSKDYLTASTAWLPDQLDITDPVKAFLNWIPQIFIAGIESLVGFKTFPKVRPLESMGQKNLPPGMRSNENTSKFAKWLGGKINISPIKIDHLITGYFGRSIGYATGQPSAWDFGSSVIRDYWFTNGRRVNGAYDLKEKNDQNYNAYQRGELELTNKERDELYRVKMLTNDFAGALSDYRKIDIEKDQEKASELRNDILTILEKIETGQKAKGFSKWKTEAKSRRKKKIKELGKL